MKTPYRILTICAAIAGATLATAYSQGESDKAKKPDRPPVEEKKADSPKKPESKPAAPESKRPPQPPKPDKKADSPKKPEAKPAAPESKRPPQSPKPDKKAEAPKPPAGPPAGKGPQRFGNLSPEDLQKIREGMRKTVEEIHKLREGGKHEEVEKKMAEVRKKMEAMREKFIGGDRGGPPSFGQRGPGPGKGGPPWAQKRPDAKSESGDARKPGPPKPPARPSTESQKQAAAVEPAERKGPPHARGEGRSEHRSSGGPGHHHRGHASRGDEDDDDDEDDDRKSKFAHKGDWQKHHRGGPGAHPRPPFAGKFGAFQRGRGGPQMMQQQRLMNMRRMAMVAQARFGKGFGFFRGSGAGKWGAAQRSKAHPKGRLIGSQRAAETKAKPGREGKKAKRSNKERASKKECEKCAKAEKDS